jgi:hypothetical protein
MNRALSKPVLAIASILSAGLMASTAFAAENDAIGVVAGIDPTDCAVTLTTGAKFYQAVEDRDSAQCGTNVVLGERVAINFNTTDGDNVINRIQRFNTEDAIGQVARIDQGMLTLANGESFALDALTKPEPAITVGDYVLVQYTETQQGQNVAAIVDLANAATDAD